MPFWTYILRCADGRYYTGHTDHLDRRIGEHQAGGFCDFTSHRLPVKLVWSQDFPSRIEALEAERRVKGWSQAKKEALIAGDWSRVSFYAKPPKERVKTGFSTTLEANGEGEKANEGGKVDDIQPPFVSSVVEKRGHI